MGTPASIEPDEGLHPHPERWTIDDFVASWTSYTDSHGYTLALPVNWRVKVRCLRAGGLSTSGMQRAVQLGMRKAGLRDSSARFSYTLGIAYGLLRDETGDDDEPLPGYLADPEKAAKAEAEREREAQARAEAEERAAQEREARKARRAELIAAAKREAVERAAQWKNKQGPLVFRPARGVKPASRVHALSCRHLISADPGKFMSVAEVPAGQAACTTCMPAEGSRLETRTATS